MPYLPNLFEMCPTPINASHLKKARANVGEIDHITYTITYLAIVSSAALKTFEVGKARFVVTKCNRFDIRTTKFSVVSPEINIGNPQVQGLINMFGELWFLKKNSSGRLRDFTGLRPRQ